MRKIWNMQIELSVYLHNIENSIWFVSTSTAFLFFRFIIILNAGHARGHSFIAVYINIPMYRRYGCYTDIDLHIDIQVKVQVCLYLSLRTITQLCRELDNLIEIDKMLSTLVALLMLLVRMLCADSSSKLWQCTRRTSFLRREVHHDVLCSTDCKWLVSDLSVRPYK